MTDDPLPLQPALARSAHRLSADYAAAYDAAGEGVATAHRADGAAGLATPAAFDRLLADMLLGPRAERPTTTGADAPLARLVARLVARWPSDMAEEAAAWELAFGTAAAGGARGGTG